MSKQSLAEYVNQIQAAGRYTFTTVEAQEVAELSQDALKSLSRLEENNRR